MKKIICVLTFIIAILITAKFHITLVRFFDPDEFVHLHYAWLLGHRFIPYRDFFIGVIPVFQWILSPLLLLPESTYIPILGRIVMFLFYMSTLFCLYLMTKIITKRQIPSLLTVIIALVFPITFDRTLDIRPDTLMMCLFLTGLILLMRYPTKKSTVFITGALFSFSFLIYMKIAFAAPAIIVYMFWKNRGKFLSSLPFLFVGFIIPILITFLSLWFSGLMSDAVTAITKDIFAFHADTPFSPLAALSPWPIIYVPKAGISIPWIVSTLLWVATITGIPIMIKKFRPTGLFFLSFFIFGTLYLFAFPRPHVQIFIPFVYMGSMLASMTFYYGALQIKKKLPKTWKFPTLFFSGISVMTVLLTSFFIQYRSRISSQSQQQEQMQALQNILSVVPNNETVYDMVGSYIFRPDASYVCCHQCPECEATLSRRVPQMKENLIAKQTKFILMDQQAYVFWKPRPSDLQFIVTHYLPSPWFKLYIPGVRFVCLLNQCIRYNLHGLPVSETETTTFDLPIRGSYRLTTDPEGQTVMINGVLMKDGDVRQFDETTYWFTPSVSFSLLFQ